MAESRVVEHRSVVVDRIMDSLMDPLLYSEHNVTVLANPSIRTCSPVATISASCEDFLSRPSIREKQRTSHGYKNSSRYSLNILEDGAIHVAGNSNNIKQGKERDTRALLLSDIVTHLISKLVPCTRKIGSVHYNWQCFYGYEVVSTLSTYLHTLTGLHSAPLPDEDKVRAICSRMLGAGIIKDARRSQNLVFKDSRLYRFSSHYSNRIRTTSQTTSSTQDNHGYQADGGGNSSDGGLLAAGGILNGYKAKLQSLAGTILSWKVSPSSGTRTMSESDEHDHFTIPITTTGFEISNNTHLLTDGNHVSPPPPDGPPKAKPPMQSDSGHCLFNPKGYPSIKIPIHKKKKKQRKSRCRIHSETSSIISHRHIIYQSSSCSSIASLAAGNEPRVIHDSKQQLQNHSTCNSSEQWVVYGYI